MLTQSFNCLLKIRPIYFCKRFKFDKKDTAGWKKTNTFRALNHFDDFYGSFYGKIWPSARLALLSQPKHCALVNYYADYESTIQHLKELGCIDIQELFEENYSFSTLKTPKKDTRSQIEEFLPVDNCELNDGTRASNDQVISERIIRPGSANSALHNFMPATKLKGMEDYVEEEDQFKYLEQDNEFVVHKENDERLVYPKILKAFMFPRGDVSKFPQPKRSSLGTSNYFLMDAASLLPVLALNLEPNDAVLDLCAAPGGKSLAILQTLYPRKLVSNDISFSRISRLKNVMQQYLGQTQTWKDRWTLKQSDARDWDESEVYDKVLVDVPCTVDRHSANEEDNSIFKQSRMKERVQLPELQSEILRAGIRACKPGGTIVYSTCSLSPIQNDGVVYMALKQLEEVDNIKVIVKDLRPTARAFGFMSRFAPVSLMRLGQQVLPSIPNNYGPMYICKMQRVE